MIVSRPVRREVHFWSEDLREPPCGAPAGGCARSDQPDHVTCAACLEALAGDGGDLRAGRGELDGDRPAP
jgi:hypothetical protein